MTEQDYQLLNLRYSCPLLRRDQIMEGKVPTAPTIASMMAALEVQEALKILHGLPVAAGGALVFNGVTNQFYSTRLPFRPDCLSHETYPAPIELALHAKDSVASLFAAAELSDLAGPLSLALERDLVVSIDCPRCGWHLPSPSAENAGVPGRVDLPDLPTAGPAGNREHAWRRIHR